MRLSALGAGLLLSVLIFSVQSDSASAQAVTVASLEPNNQLVDRLAVLDLVEEQNEPAAPAAAPEPTKHKVAEGETLTAIANQHQTTWQRLFFKNAHVENPDMVNPGTELIVPTADEQLAERTIPVAAPEPVVTTSKPKAAASTEVSAARGSSAGNTYSWGYCTWYVKNMRPDLPNNLGNAYTWVSRAAAQGIPTGSEPRVGAAGQRGNHVVYVESVNGDGTVTISEMNHTGVGVRTVRTVPADYFQYIY